MKLNVASPCSESWEQMSGDDRLRFCRRCKLNVYNFSSMSEEEARSAVYAAEGRVCGRFFMRPDGTVLTKDCPVGWWKKLRRRVAIVAGLAVTGVVGWILMGELRADAPMPGWLQAFIDLWREPDPPALMGEIVCPTSSRPPGP